MTPSNVQLVSVEHRDPIEQAVVAKSPELLGDLIRRNGAVKGVGTDRVRLEIDHVGAGEDEAVVVRLVAVPVDEDDISRRDDGLMDDLVRRGCAVGDEEGVAAAERAAGPRLGVPDGPVRIQERVQAAGGRRCLSEEEVHAVELLEVVDPGGVPHRSCTGDRHRVEDAAGLAA